MRGAFILAATVVIIAIILLGLSLKTTEPPATTTTPPEIMRKNKIPVEAEKVTPTSDSHPPILHSSLYEDPVPLGAGVNTAGGEDSPFITPDGATLYFFFTPDVSIPAEQQLFDGVTGIWVSTRRPDGTWGEAERIHLQDKGKLALDGAEYVSGDTMLFASAREGYEGIGWYQADRVDGIWTNWRNVDDLLKTEEYQTGELHISSDGSTLYFHSTRPGGAGGLDIWTSTRDGDTWGEPETIPAVNTLGDEGWPALSPIGDELWFIRTYLGTPAIYRSLLVDGEWDSPELVLSQFAGEPSVDEAGNLYFVHHYYRDNIMIEADIYVARPKTSP
jgi:hypothetical protein